jgi:hypothetical protein
VIVAEAPRKQRTDEIRRVDCAVIGVAGPALFAMRLGVLSTTRSSTPLSKISVYNDTRLKLSVHVDMPVRRELRTLAAQLDVTLQLLLCQAINDLLEKHGRERMADEGMLPRGGGAHKSRNP